jgi:tetratricopeptide (TPR) repeat protein
MLATADAMADDLAECANPGPAHSIASCSALIEAPATPPAVRARAYFLRALSYSRLGQYERAIPDLDGALRLDPDFASALNNRANAYNKIGKPAEGEDDIDRALALMPQEPVFNATRGEISQALGDRDGAMQHHEAAMAFGGRLFVQLYQCSLRLAGLYRGPIDGIIRPELRTALRACVDQGSRCPPLPPFLVSECPDPVA